MHGIAARVRAAIENRQKLVVPARIQDFHLDEHVELTKDVERLGERGDGFAVREGHGAEVAPARLRNRQTEDRRIVMDDDLAVDRGVDIELHAVGSLAGGRTERGQGVLQRNAGGAPVGNHQRLHCCRLSAFFGSIQFGSLSISCTRAMSSGRGSTDSR